MALMLSLEAKRWWMPKRSAALRNAVAVNSVRMSHRLLNLVE